MTISLSGVRVGARKPPLRSVPDYASTSGHEFVELGATAGLFLDEWQADSLIDGLGERADGQWAAREVAAVVSRQNGKGSIFEVRALGGLILSNEQLIVWTAHEVKTALEAFRRCQALFTNYDDLRRRVRRVSHQNGEEGIELITGQRLRFLARSKGSGRGFTADCLIWDEAYALTDDQVEAQMPVLSAVPNWQIWYGSSPPLNSVDGAVLMRIRRRALAGDPQLAYFGWEIPGVDLSDLSSLDLDDIGLAYATNPAMGIRITEETVRAQRAAMSDTGYARERLGVFPQDLTAGFLVLPEADWQAAQDPLSRIDGAFALSVAVSLDRSRATICAAGYRADGLAHVEVTANAHVIDARPGTAWVVPRIKEIVGRRRPCVLVIDAGGPAGSLIADIDNAFLSPSGDKTFEVTRIGTADVARGYGMFFDAVSGEDREGRILRHLGQPELTSSVAGAVTRSMGPGATTWDAKNALVDITPLVAATNALYGLAVYGQIDDGPIVLEGALFGEDRDDDAGDR